VWKSGECTFCAPERFFSFRRERDEAGRMVSFIGRVKSKNGQMPKMTREETQK